MAIEWGEGEEERDEEGERGWREGLEELGRRCVRGIRKAKGSNQPQLTRSHDCSTAVTPEGRERQWA